MENFKIENYRRDNPNTEFPDYRTLPEGEAKDIAGRLSSKLRLRPEASDLELVSRLRDLSDAIPNVDAAAEDFDLLRSLEKSGIVPESKVQINWHRFEVIDEMRTADLSKHFSDIWYPAADCIDLFDNTLRWVASVDYSGSLLVLKLD